MSDIPVTAEIGEEYPTSQALSDDRDVHAIAVTPPRPGDIVDDWGCQSFPASDPPQNW